MPAGKAALNKRLLVGIVLDRSSSMSSVRDETISGTNEQFSALRDSEDADNTFVSFLSFNQQVTPVLKDEQGNLILVPCADLQDINTGDYFPSGMTAMRDGVNAMIEFFSAEAKKADDVLIVVISDGAENASREITSDELASKVKELQDSGWNFTYIGANQDLTQVAADLGIHQGNMLGWQASSAGAAQAHGTVSSAIGSYTATRSALHKKGLVDRVTTQNLYDMNDGGKTFEGNVVEPTLTSDGPVTVTGDVTEKQDEIA